MEISPKRDYSPGLRRMRTYLCRRFVDSIVDRGGVVLDTPTRDDAREALLAIETHHLTIGALRMLVEHPNNEEARAHAQRVLAQCSEIFKPTPPPAPKAEVQGVDDLV